MTYYITNRWTHEETSVIWGRKIATVEREDDAVEIVRALTAAQHPADDLQWYEIYDEAGTEVCRGARFDEVECPF